MAIGVLGNILGKNLWNDGHFGKGNTGGRWGRISWLLGLGIKLCPSWWVVLDYWIRISPGVLVNRNHLSQLSPVSWHQKGILK